MEKLSLDIENGDRAAESGIVFFDFDDALISGSSWRAVHEQLGVVNEANKHYEKYKNGSITFSEWGDLDAGLWKNASKAEIATATQQVDRLDEVAGSIGELRSDGFVVGVVSGGVDCFIEEVLSDVDLDFLIANTLSTENGHITGNVDMKVTPDTKQKIFDEVADMFSIPLDQTIAVGNSADDFQRDLQGLQIGLNPSDSQTRKMSDEVVESDSLGPVLKPIQEWRSGS